RRLPDAGGDGGRHSRGPPRGDDRSATAPRTGDHGPVRVRLAIGGGRRWSAARRAGGGTGAGVRGGGDRKRAGPWGEAMPSKRGTGATRRKRKTAGPAKAGTKAPRGADDGSFEQAIQRAVTGGGTVSVGLVNLVKNTLVTAISGARDVGGEMGTAAVAAVRGSIRAASEIGADLGAGARDSIMGTSEAAEQSGGERGRAAPAATRQPA